MSGTLIFMIIALFIVFAGSVFFGVRILMVNHLNRSGKNADRATASILRKFAFLRGFKVLHNVRFTYKSKDYHIENMLVGYFGILLVHTLGGQGEYYGQLDVMNWQRILDGKKHPLPNPIMEMEGAMTALRGIFSQNKVYNVPMEAIAVMTNRSRKTQLHVTNEGRIFLPGKLRPYLDKTKFEKDAGVDIARVTALIEQSADIKGK